MSKDTKANSSQSNMMITGMVLGMIFGAAVGQIAWGFSIGLLSGLTMQAIQDRQQEKAESGLSLTTVGIAFVTVSAILIAELSGSGEITVMALAALGLLVLFVAWVRLRRDQSRRNR